MDAVQIRGAVVDDLPALRTMFSRASWANEGDRPLLERHPELLVLPDTAVRDGRTRVATIGGQIAGFSSIVAAGDRIELEDLFVEPDWMRRGVGRALVVDVAELARTTGAWQVEVNANEHALPFYEEVGFVVGGTVTLEHGTAVHMALVVGPAPNG